MENSKRYIQGEYNWSYFSFSIICVTNRGFLYLPHYSPKNILYFIQVLPLAAPSLEILIPYLKTILTVSPT